ncbi:MAG: FoF1 ATP synthase subunit a [Patescibacteria group bacterium]
MAAESLHISIAPYHLGDLWGFPITPTLISSSVVVVLLLVAAFFIGRNLKVAPSKGQLAVEEVVLGVYNYVREVLEDDVLARRYFPIIMSIFVYVTAANLFGLFPFIGALGFYDEAHHGFIPLLYPVNTDLNAPIALAIISFVVIEFAGIAALGFLKYFSKFVNFTSVIGFIVGIIELISEVARLITFSFRLFGNIFAGKVLILLALFFVPYIAPVPLVLYEAFVSVIQGAVFALLTLFFIKIAVTPHGEH